MWKTKAWHFLRDGSNRESKEQAMRRWMRENKDKYQMREIFVCNGYAVEYRELRSVAV